MGATAPAGSRALAPGSELEQPSEHIPRSLGERFGWLYGSAWLVFLLLPVLYIIASDATVWEKALGVAMVIVFAVVYVRSSRSFGPSTCSDQQTTAPAWRALAWLTMIALATVPLFGGFSLAFTPYLCAFAMLALPLRYGIAVSVVNIAVATIVTITAGAEYSEFIVITTGVSIATAAVATFVRSGRRTEELRLRLSLASDQERVARDVHDVLGHSLTAVVVKSELAQRLVVTDPEAALRELSEIEELSRTALANIRATVDGLRATRLVDEVEAARLLLSTVGIELSVPERCDDVDPRASVMLAWAVREAVTNIVRHSDAQHATIRWGRDWVEVTDDGRGIDNRDDGDSDGDADHGPGNGLAGLRERAAALGGSVSVGSGPDGTGTTVRVGQK